MVKAVQTSDSRVYGPLPAAAFVVGTVVGTGIYLKPGLVVALLADPWQIYFIWFLGGAFATAGALVYTHLAANWPENGGPFVYLRAVYGPWAASLLLAADVFLARPAAVGALASGLGLIWGLPPSQGLVLALLTVSGLSLVQLLGRRVQGWSQTALTILQLLPLLGIVFIAPFSEGSSPGEWANQADSAQWAAAFLAVLWAYDGWYNITILAGEVRSPQKTLRGSLFGGMAFVTGLYLVLNWALLGHVQRERLISEPIGFLLLLQDWNLGWLGTATQLALSAALLATLNGTLACGARMVVAGASRGLLNPGVGSDPTALRPTLCFALWCIGLLALFGGLDLEKNLFDSLTEFTAVIVAALSALTVSCLFHSNKFQRKPGPAPWLAGIFYLAVTAVLLVLMVKEANWMGLAGVVTVGMLGTFLWGRRSQSI